MYVLREELDYPDSIPALSLTGYVTLDKLFNLLKP